jgi:hypothetical protein
MCDASKAPAWFRARDYTYLGDLDAEGWLNELERCRAKLGGWADQKEGWRFLFGEEIDQLIPAEIGLPPVQRIGSSEELDSFVPPRMVLVVDLSAPDDVIRQAFDRILTAARKKSPGPVRRRGKQAGSDRFTESHFATWRTRRIIEIAELDAWFRGRMRAGEPGAKRGAIAGWVFPDRPQPSKDLHLGRAMLERAITSIPALWAQVHASRK